MFELNMAWGERRVEEPEPWLLCIFMSGALPLVGYVMTVMFVNLGKAEEHRQHTAPCVHTHGMLVQQGAQLPNFLWLQLST